MCETNGNRMSLDIKLNEINQFGRMTILKTRAKFGLGLRIVLKVYFLKRIGKLVIINYIIVTYFDLDYLSLLRIFIPQSQA